MNRKRSIGLVVLLSAGMTVACGEGAEDAGGAGGSESAGGSAAAAGGAGSGGASASGGASTSGGAGGSSGGASSGGSSAGGSGGGEVALGCPSGDAPPTGDCTEWSNVNTAEVCEYGATQCYCQTGQQGASWRCGACPTTVADGDECSVTDMTCGGCTCEMSFVQGGQREWRFSCGG